MLPAAACVVPTEPATEQCTQGSQAVVLARRTPANRPAPGAAGSGSGLRLGFVMLGLALAQVAMADVGLILFNLSETITRR